MRCLPLALILALSACITPKEKKDMQGDIFNVQTRLLNLERNLTDSSKKAEATGENANKRLANTASEMDRVNHELQQLHGDIDALRVGVATGQMPGGDASAQENSVAATLAKLSERVESMEQAQEELLDALKKAGLTSKKKAHKSLSGPQDLEQAYNDKHYKQVIEDAPKVLKEAGGSDKEQVRFLLAESYFKIGKMREAALKYNEFLEGKPSAKLVPTVKMRIGDCFRHLGDVATAKVYYEELIKEFPDSDEAAKAKERLAEGKNGGAGKG